MHDLVPCINSKRNRTCLECNKIPVLKLPKNSPKMNLIENIWNIMKKDIDNQLPCLKEEMWKRVCDAWYSVAPNILEKLNNSMPRTIADFIKQMEMQRILTLIYDVGVQVCSCVFNGMHLSMLLCFHWDAFNIHIQIFLIIR